MAHHWSCSPYCNKKQTTQFFLSREMPLSWTSLGTATVSSALGEATKMSQQSDLQEEPPQAEELLTSTSVPALLSPEHLFLPMRYESL